VSAASIEKIWAMWRRKAGSIVLPGHDLPMVLQDGRPVFIGTREAGIAAIFGDTTEDRTIFNLTLGAAAPARNIGFP
jgi:N-acyl homoserine lactone hydrolase